MNELKDLKQGTFIKCTIDSNISRFTDEHVGIIEVRSAVIIIYEGIVFICQNLVCSGSQGRDIPNKYKLGYDKAWFVKSGSEEDCEKFGVSNIEVISEVDPNIDRII